MNNPLEQAKLLTQNYNNMLVEEEELIQRIENEGKLILPQIKELIEKMDESEFVQFYNSLANSDLKFAIFKFIKNKTGNS